jgi:O-antigen/teichoic acid export membrane protein
MSLVARSFRPRAGGLAAASAGNALPLFVALLLRGGGLGLLLVVLGPGGQGRVALAQLIASVGAALTCLGLETAITPSSARADARADAGAAFWTVTLWSFALVSLALIVLEWLATPSTAVVVGVVGVGSQVVTRCGAAAALGEGRSRSYAALTVAPLTLYVIALVALLTTGSLDTRAALWALCISFLVSAAAGLAGIARWMPPAVVRHPTTSATLILGIQLLPGMAANLVNYRVDQILVATFLPPAQLGLYSFAVAASEVGTVPAQAVANIVLRRSGRRHDLAAREARRAALSAYPLAVALIPLWLALLIVALPAYRPAIAALLLLCIGAGSIGCLKICAAFLTGRGLGWVVSKVSAMVVGVTVAADLALIPILGIAGAATASLLAYSVSAAFLWRIAGGDRALQPRARSGAVSAVTAMPADPRVLEPTRVSLV